MVIMAEKYYAVKEGASRGIFRTWEECRASVSGYSGAVYKSFKTKEEALSYLGLGQCSDVRQNSDTEKDIRADADILEESGKSTAKDVCKAQDCVKIYVDGSYNNATGEFSYGMVVLSEEGEEKYNCKFNDQELAAMHNVAGEIKGAQAAMQYALEHQIPAIAIYHDYEGIAKWCLGQWKTNKEGTKAYKAFYDMASRQVKISFVKVTGHSNDKYNDMADKLAKEALGIQ